MNILLTGASGFIGRNLSAALISAGHTVRPISRSHGLDFTQLCQADSWLPHLQGIDAVINCVGIIGESASQRFATLHTAAPKALFDACAASGVRRVLQISALGADNTAFSAYHLSKLAADDYLRSLDLDWLVLRPSLLYGRGGKSSELFMRVARWPLIPLLGAGQQQLQPLHISDLVATVLHGLGNNARLTLDLVGDDRVSFADWLQRMRLAQGLGPGRFVHMPLLLARLAIGLGQYFNPMARKENLRMLEQGYWADAQSLADFLGRRPVPFDPVLFFTDGTELSLAGRSA